MRSPHAAAGAVTPDEAQIVRDHRSELDALDATAAIEQIAGRPDAGLPDYSAIVGPRCRAVWLSPPAPSRSGPTSRTSDPRRRRWPRCIAAPASNSRTRPSGTWTSAPRYRCTDGARRHRSAARRGGRGRAAGHRIATTLCPNLPGLPRFGNQVATGTRGARACGDHRRQRGHWPAVCPVLHRTRGADGHPVEPQRC